MVEAVSGISVCAVLYRFVTAVLKRVFFSAEKCQLVVFTLYLSGHLGAKLALKLHTSGLVPVSGRQGGCSLPAVSTHLIGKIQILGSGVTERFGGVALSSKRSLWFA